MKFFLFTLFISIASSAASAKGILPTLKERTEYMKRGEVWFAPEWIDSQFRFSPQFDILAGPPATEDEASLLSDAINCNLVPNGVGEDTGMTRKFVCEITTTTGKTMAIKVKYGEGNAEIFGELLATRLFWALGFGADHMFYMARTNCYGCSDDPFKKTNLDPSTIETPRVFNITAIERKFKGTNIAKPTIKYVEAQGYSKVSSRIAVPDETSGWSFNELMNVLSDDHNIRNEQITKRNALALLTAFVNHSDNKGVNQRLVCMDPLDANGKCNGRVAMIVQDLGATFGKGLNLKIRSILRVDQQGWSKTPIWRDPAKCIAGVSYWMTQSYNKIVINESGRQFIVKLLKGFSEGTAGRKRVEDLFRAGHVEHRSEVTPEQWAEVFIRKIKELEFPMGDNHPEFKCPKP